MALSALARTLAARYWLPSGGALLVCAALGFHACFQLTIVVGDSMLPTLRPGQVLLVNRLAYRHEDPQREDIVMARYGSGFIVKRIVGLPEEEVEVRHGAVYIDGLRQQENHEVQQGALDVHKGRLFEGDFATLGDNRAIAAALAIHPILSKPDIVGRVMLRGSGNVEPSPPLTQVPESLIWRCLRLFQRGI